MLGLHPTSKQFAECMGRTVNQVVNMHSDFTLKSDKQLMNQLESDQRLINQPESDQELINQQLMEELQEPRKIRFHVPQLKIVKYQEGSLSN